MGHGTRTRVIFTWLTLIASLSGVVGYGLASRVKALRWAAVVGNGHTVVAIPQSPLRIKATGHQYFWRFAFPGNDQKFGTRDDVVVHRALHLPLHSEVELFIESDDYVYSFSAPTLRLRRIAVPELTYPLHFQTHTPGKFDLIVDPFCGVSVFHDENMGRIVIQSEEDFESWYLANQSKARHATDG